MQEHTMNIIRSNNKPIEEGSVSNSQIVSFRSYQEPNRKSISMMSLPFFNKVPKIQSSLFKDKHFYIESSQRNER